MFISYSHYIHSSDMRLNVYLNDDVPTGRAAPNVKIF